MYSPNSMTFTQEIGDSSTGASLINSIMLWFLKLWNDPTRAYLISQTNDNLTYSQDYVSTIGSEILSLSSKEELRDNKSEIRELCYNLIQNMPDDALTEMLEVLVNMNDFYLEKQTLLLSEKVELDTYSVDVEEPYISEPIQWYEE